MILCLLVPLLVTATLSGAVAVLSLLQAQADLAEARYRFVAGQLRSTIEQRLTLGLPLEELRQSSDLFARTTTRDPDIAAILVFDAAGIVRHGTDIGDIGEPVPEAWRSLADPTATAAAADRPGAAVVAPLLNSYGDVAGGLVLVYGRLGETVRTEQAIAVFGGVGLLLGAVAIIVAALAASACLAGHRRTLAALSKRLAILAADPNTADPGGGPGTLDAHLDNAGRAFEGRAAAAWCNIAARQAEIERLDELA